MPLRRWKQICLLWAVEHRHQNLLWKNNRHEYLIGKKERKCVSLYKWMLGGWIHQKMTIKNIIWRLKSQMGIKRSLQWPYNQYMATWSITLLSFHLNKLTLLAHKIYTCSPSSRRWKLTWWKASICLDGHTANAPHVSATCYQR